MWRLSDFIFLTSLCEILWPPAVLPSTASSSNRQYVSKYRATLYSALSVPNTNWLQKRHRLINAFKIILPPTGVEPQPLVLQRAIGFASHYSCYYIDLFDVDCVNVCRLLYISNMKHVRAAGRQCMIFQDMHACPPNQRAQFELASKNV